MAHATRPAGRFAAWVAQYAGQLMLTPDMARVGSDVISFGGGQPAAELYPLAALERAFSRAILEQGRQLLPYGAIEGLLGLREIVAERLEPRGIRVSPDNVVITTGSMQGLHLVGRVMLDFGDTVITEAPTFPAALGTWEHQQPLCMTIPVDDDGIRVDELENTLRSAAQPPKFAYLLPTFQNPTGVSLTIDRRRRLLEIAHQYDLVILEDDPYGEFWYDAGREPLPPLRAMPGGDERVVYIGTFSKILAPGLRLAYVIASPAVIPLLVRAKRGVDYQTDALVQQAVVRMVRDGDFDLEAHIATCRRAYKERRDAMLDALETTPLFAQRTTWTRPAGGYFLWIDLPRGVSGEEVARAALAEGVQVWPGQGFYPNRDGGENGIRLSFADASPERIREGVRRLERGVAAVAQ